MKKISEILQAKHNHLVQKLVAVQRLEHTLLSREKKLLELNSGQKSNFGEDLTSIEARANWNVWVMSQRQNLHSELATVTVEKNRQKSVMQIEQQKLEAARSVLMNTKYIAKKKQLISQQNTILNLLVNKKP